VTTRTFVAWVKPIATRLRESRRQIVDTARSIPAESWQRQSPMSDWSYKDVLCHLAAGDFFCRAVVTAVVERMDLDLRPVSSARDVRNAAFINERRNRTIDELIAEVQAEGARTQELLCRLNEADQATLIFVSNRDALPTTLSDYLATFSSHDVEHMRQLLTAAEVAA
jgi:uncharacterized damage-inducible protein DinB